MQQTADHGRLFEQDWQPQAYLQAYYPTDSVTVDEQAILSYLVRYLKATGRRFRDAIEVGCGPTIHHVVPVVPYVDELHVADLVPDNLAAVRAWLTAAPNAYDWDLYVRTVLDLETGAPGSTEDAVAERKQQVRSVITALKHVDLRDPLPLGEQRTYDLVLSFYCADSATASKDEWHMFMQHLLTLLAPGGTLIVSALRQAPYYTVANHRFPSAHIDEHDLAAMFADAAIIADDVDIHVVEVTAWHDFSSVIIARAHAVTDARTRTTTG